MALAAHRRATMRVRIYVTRVHACETFAMDAHQTDTINEVKAMIKNVINREESIELIFKDILLADTLSIAAYNIEEGATLQLVVRA